MATTHQSTGTPGAVRTLMRRLARPAVSGGLLGGLLMIVVMILVMGISGMGVPTPKVRMIGQLMSGQATNDTVATLMNEMPQAARTKMMGTMPVDASHVIVGAAHWSM